jgi:hypothetical protein
MDLHVVRDGARQMTGVLAFGKGGTGAPTKYAPTTGSGATDIGVRDIMMNFPDIDDDTRLQAAADANYNILKGETEQWQFGLHVWPDGPAFAAPGRLLNLWVYGDAYLEDGKHPQRVIALSGDMSYSVTPEVQYAA